VKFNFVEKGGSTGKRGVQTSSACEQKSHNTDHADFNNINILHYHTNKAQLNSRHLSKYSTQKCTCEIDSDSV